MLRTLRTQAGLCALGFLLSIPAMAQAPAAAAPAPAPAVVYDAELAAKLGGNDNGMKRYVLVVLKTGPNKITDPDERKKMFQGHMDNIGRMAAEKQLVVAGPLDGVDGWRGMYIFNTPDIATAKGWVATDPVIVKGEMVAEYHTLFGSAGLMAVTDIHNRITKPAAGALKKN
ncbi:MAG: YciI family protein [Pseudomonadota bacterium]